MKKISLPMTGKDLTEAKERLRSRGRGLIVGLTGGIATGKSMVSLMLEELGAPLIDFDALAREAVEPGTDGFKNIVTHFGIDILKPDGLLDRKHLSRMVFKDRRQREKLEALTHPAIFEAFFNRVECLHSSNPNALILASVPLLMELSLQPLFHTIILVYAARRQQIERLVKRDGITGHQAENIINAQLPIEEKLSSADYVIKNEGSIEDTRRQVEKIWQTLKSLNTEQRKPEKHCAKR